MGFEKRWKERESKLKECDGFVAFSMLRRDGQAKGHGTVEMTSDEPTYQSTTIWRDRASSDKWREGNNFKAAHGQKPKEEGEGEKKGGASGPPAGPPPQWSRPPTP